jgi:hypothetical protein
LVLAHTPYKTNPIEVNDLTQPSSALSAATRYFRIDRRHISYLRFILEAYEGMAVLTTIDAGEGIVKLMMAPGSEPVITEVLDDLCARQAIMMETLSGYGRATQGDG